MKDLTTPEDMSVEEFQEKLNAKDKELKETQEQLTKASAALNKLYNLYLELVQKHIGL